jgi:hypothetical protein
MTNYDYREAVKDDVREYINNEIDFYDWKGNRDGLEEHLNDTLFTCDSVTGNASGSYTFNSCKAEENICHNLDLLGEALQEFGCTSSYLIDKGAEAADVTIRCYLLPGAISDILDEFEEELEEEPEEEDD